MRRLHEPVTDRKEGGVRDNLKSRPVSARVGFRGKVALEPIRKHINLSVQARTMPEEEAREMPEEEEEDLPPAPAGGGAAAAAKKAHRGDVSIAQRLIQYAGHGLEGSSARVVRCFWTEPLFDLLKRESCRAFKEGFKEPVPTDPIDLD
jgi:hypothetical protein